MIGQKMPRINFNNRIEGSAFVGPSLHLLSEDAAFNFNYTLSKDGYIIIHNGAARLLLDTGAPFSFGEKLAGIPSVTGSPAKDVAGFTAQKLSKAMDCHVDGVIGAETLRTQTLHIDPSAQKLVFLNTKIKPEHGVHIHDKMNVPVINVEFDGHGMPTIFDTGAPLGYVPRSMTEGHEPIGIFDDFYPLCGAFRTEVFDITVRIGNREDVVSFGVLPKEIENIHSNNGCPTIIGLGLLKNHKITLGLREGLMKLEPLA